MKTSIKTLIATGIIALAVSSSTVYAATGSTNPIYHSAKAIPVVAIKKLTISGNIEVTISQQPKSKAFYHNEGTAEVIFKKVGNQLIISPKNDNETAKITVFIDDIYRIEASGNAVIRTKEEITLKYLQVFLKDNAYLDLDAKTESLYTVMQNTSTLQLKGATDFHTISMDRLARVTLDRFTAKKTDMSASDVYIAARR